MKIPAYIYDPASHSEIHFCNVISRVSLTSEKVEKPEGELAHPRYLKVPVLKTVVFKAVVNAVVVETAVVKAVVVRAVVVKAVVVKAVVAEAVEAELAKGVVVGAVVMVLEGLVDIVLELLELLYPIPGASTDDFGTVELRD